MISSEVVVSRLADEHSCMYARGVDNMKVRVRWERGRKEEGGWIIII